MLLPALLQSCRLPLLHAVALQSNATPSGMQQQNSKQLLAVASNKQQRHNFVKSGNAGAIFADAYISE